jgi:hypothetical protein
MRDAIEASATDETIAEVLSAILQKARKGDLAAAQLWLDRVLGKAAQAVVHSGDGEPIQIIINRPPQSDTQKSPN